MFKRTLLAIAALGCGATASAATAQVAGDGCYGTMTIERLSDPSCQARIPVPVFRSDAPAAPDVVAVPAEPPVYITSVGTDGEERTVRLVGTRYLPQEADTIDFRASSLENSNVLGRFFIAAAALLEDDASQAEFDVAEVAESAQDEVAGLPSETVAF